MLIEHRTESYASWDIPLGICLHCLLIFTYWTSCADTRLRDSLLNRILNAQHPHTRQLHNTHVADLHMWQIHTSSVCCSLMMMLERVKLWLQHRSEWTRVPSNEAPTRPLSDPLVASSHDPAPSGIALQQQS